MPWQDALWPYLPTLMRLGLALGLGMFTGLERERRGKEAGLRTFAFAALLGCLGSLLGDAYALLALALLGFLVTFLNLHELRANQGTGVDARATARDPPAVRRNGGAPRLRAPVSCRGG